MTKNIENGYLNFDKFEKKVRQLNTVYWNDSYQRRWEYMEIVIAESKRINPKTSLETGVNKIAIMSFSDLIDIHIENLDEDNKIHNHCYIKDASITPYDYIEDQKYDLVVAMQVLEHLNGKQKKVFAELKRISHYAILTLPYKWNCKEDCHHMIDEKTINEWSNNYLPYKTEIIKNRIMVCYDFTK